MRYIIYISVYKMSHSPPESYLCPITYNVMVDPVIAPDGRTYERASICQWLQNHGTSPFTRETMCEDDLIPNMVLRGIIEENMSSSLSSTVDFIPSTALSERPPIVDRKTIHCLVDQSGSMGLRIITPGYEQDGFTRLDLVKHTITTLVHSLPSEYALSITTFDSSARTFLGVTPMDVQGKSDAIRSIGYIRDGTMTNMWDGLRKVIELCEDGSSPVIMLFTDGQSNMEPPRGIRDTLRTHLTRREITPTIHTLGYSYDIDSHLLHSLANEYNGLFGFIPDCTMIGTVFINLLSKVIEMTEGTSVSTGAGYTTVPKCLTLVEYLMTESHSSSSVNERVYRIEELKELVRDIPVTTEFTEEYKQDILVDLDHPDPDKGQIGKAISNDEWYRKWGEHYLRSVHLAHMRGVCINFKDASLKWYRSDRFKHLQDRMESIFVSLPSPEPTSVPTTNPLSIMGGTRSDGSVAPPLMAGVTQMSTYYDDSAGCFTGDTLVLTKQGFMTEYRSIASLSPGDIVSTTSESEFAFVRFIVKYEELTTDVCHLNNELHITKYHPVKRISGDEGWTFPKDIVPPEKTTSTVYNLILSSGHMVRCKGYECVTLGHNMTDNGVVEHSYFGTEVVVNDIIAEHIRQGGDGDSGVVVVRTLRARRNPESGLIEGYVFNEHE